MLTQILQTGNLILPLAVILIAAFVSILIEWTTKEKNKNQLWLIWMLAIFPFAALSSYIGLLSQVIEGEALAWHFDWIPALGISFNLYYDSLSALFALLVSGIGTLVIIYSAYYFKGKSTVWRFLTYLFLFMFFMLGLVTAGDLITLFIFWEGTSITSFLLIGFQSDQEKARRGAFMSLLITAGGGVALLIGSILIQYVSGSFEFSAILRERESLISSNLYPAILILIALGAFTKSAQVPFHFWLPNAMSAPTPASAYLHSATMVKAGIYLMARLNPSLGFTESWFWLLSLVGFSTLIIGAYLGLKQNDLKGLLAYSTISQLGALMALIAQDTSIAFKALVIGVVAHALYKSALFLLVGIIDHETGTRDLRQLGGLRKLFPGVYLFTLIAGLSMAGLPPLFGFLAKETLLATATHPSVPPIMDVVFPIITVIAGSFMIALSGMFIWEVFHAPAKQKINFSHRPPFWMVAMPAIPATISLGLGLLPEPKWLAGFLAQAAKNAYNAPVKVSLALWTGISVPVILSAVVVIFGTLLFINRQVIRNWQNKIFASFSIEKIYDNSLNILDRIANLAVRLQAGRLRIYLAIMLLSVGFLVFAFGELPFQTFFGDFRLFQNPTNTETNFLRLYVLFITIGASLASLVIQRDVYAILALGISGLAVATWFLLEPAPDVALVQVVVDILSIVILVLALVRLPKSQRQMIPSLNIRIKRLGFWRDLLISLAAGVVVTLISYQALISRPRTSLVTPYYQFNARSMTGATDVVSAVLVDFRGFDTMNEIIVFSVAGLGIYALLRTAIPVNKSQTTSKTDPDCASEPQARDASSELHITNPRSPLVRVLATLTLPLAFMIALTHIMFGHIQPGDGFTAGVILSLAIGLSYIIFGYYQTIDKIAWLNPRTFIASGILLILLSGTASWLFNGAFLSNQDFSNFLNFPKPPGFKISSSFFFEIGIFLVVLGSTDLMIDSLGHPGERIDCVEKVDILE